MRSASMCSGGSVRGAGPDRPRLRVTVFVPGLPPDGEPMPSDGRLEAAQLDSELRKAFGIYVHVPFCVTRCGYCDFNTYTAAELGGGASRESYAALAIEEIRFARR